MQNILIKIEEKRGYFTITYFRAKNKTEYKTNKRVLGYYSIQKDNIKDVQDFLIKIKHYYIDCLSGSDLVIIRE